MKRSKTSEIFRYWTIWRSPKLQIRRGVLIEACLPRLLVPTSWRKNTTACQRKLPASGKSSKKFLIGAIAAGGLLLVGAGGWYLRQSSDNVATNNSRNHYGGSQHGSQRRQ